MGERVKEEFTGRGKRVCVRERVRRCEQERETMRAMISENERDN